MNWYERIEKLFFYPFTKALIIILSLPMWSFRGPSNPSFSNFTLKQVFNA